ncbi:MAG: SCP2 sterol-binding domain-containing protein [Gammaproteobacteria bacterium]|nr:SCP2 sterol-binding domain-containing protein [Gammaproteobacteria bacterium]
MRLPAPVLMSMEMAFNRVLRMDPESLEAFDGLSGKVIVIDAIGTGLILYLMPALDGVRLADHYDGQVDATIRGGLFSLLHTAMTHERDRVLSGDVKIEGDVRLGQRVQHILKNMELDWEEPLSRVVGDVAAHQLGRAAQDAFSFFSRTVQGLLRDSAEYVTEERRDVPSKVELDDYYNRVDEVRAHVDRVAARIMRLQTQLENNG